jgi:hypothetical protein
VTVATYTDLWRFSCPRHGSFDVWGEDWTDVPLQQRPRDLQRLPHLNFEPEDVRTTRCPGCGQYAHPVGPVESLA